MVCSGKFDTATPAEWKIFLRGKDNVKAQNYVCFVYIHVDFRLEFTKEFGLGVNSRQRLSCGLRITHYLMNPNS